MRKLNNFILISITISAIVNLRGLALMASGGLTTLGLSLLAALCFLIPSTYVCAKLGSHILKRGGVYEWVTVAFGAQWGCLAIWLEWINNIVEFPATLAAIAGMLFLLFSPTPPSAWVYTLWMLAVLWITLWYNQWPLKISSWLNVIGSAGTVFIAALIIVLGLVWLFSGAREPLDIQRSFHFSLGEIAIFVSFIGAYSGMQITGFHTSDVEDPRHEYKVALPIAAAIVMVMMLGASGIMALLIPSDKLNVIAGAGQMVEIFSTHFHLPDMGLVISIFIFIAMLASFSAWVLGPARGMQAALAEAGIDNKLSRLNQHKMPVGILWVQGIVTTALIATFLILPTVKTAFWMMVAITSQFTALMYTLVFAAGLKLIAKTWVGKLLCCLGIISCIIGFVVGVFAPTQLKLVTYHAYTFIVLAGDVVLILLGFFFAKIITSHKKET
jgi:glutamate:GABA antiporter